MKIRHLMAVAVLTPFLSAGATPVVAADAPPSAEPADVLVQLHHSNQKEIEMGRLAKTQGQSQAVQEFGGTLEMDHTAADEKVAALARKKDVDLTAPAGEEPKHPLPAGAEFDEHFAKMMVEDHKKDIATVENARDKTTDADLKELLTELLPTLEKHLAAAEALEKK